jgi:hypothetical protein
MSGSWYKPKLETPWNLINLGAGVQSSALALMAAQGEVTPMPNGAVFADTQAEPEGVYKWLAWLEAALPFPVYRVSKGSLTESQLRLRTTQDGTNRKWAKSLIPAYIANPDGTRGIMGRACTFDFKILEVEKAVRRLAGVKRGQSHCTVTQWFGISADEKQRMKDPRHPWTQHRWPLVELGMTRAACIEWMERNGYPKPPRSACVYCPFHSDTEWRRLRDEEPHEFERAVRFEKQLQDVKAQTDNIKGVPYLHPSLKPLDAINFDSAEERGQGNLFLNECEGLCGV